MVTRSSWVCPEPGSNRHGVASEGFSYHFGFRRQCRHCSWSGARLHPSQKGLRCPPSALYTFPWSPKGLARRWLGYQQARAFTEFDGLHPWRFPQRAQIDQVPCVYQFHHPGRWSAALSSERAGFYTHPSSRSTGATAAGSRESSSCAETTKPRERGALSGENP